MIHDLQGDRINTHYQTIPTGADYSGPWPFKYYEGKKINKKEDKIYGKNNFRKIATITLFESAVQWYCFLLYGTAAGTVFNKVFFHRREMEQQR